MTKLMKFYWTEHGWIVGKYNSDEDEFSLPSGYIAPVVNGKVYWVDGWYELIDM